MAKLEGDNDRPDASNAFVSSESGATCKVLGAASGPNGVTATLRALLAGADRCSLAVGYLFVEGLHPLLDDLGRVQRIDLLIGNVVNRLTEEQMREMGDLGEVATRGDQAFSGGLSDTEFAAQYRSTRNKAALETSLNLRRTLEALPHSGVNRDTIVALAQWIAEGRLQVRLSTQSRLHAKVSLLSYPAGHPHAPGRAIVGSSNLTLPAKAMPTFSTGPQGAVSDLDILLDGEDNYQSIREWFQTHWAEAQDFRRELFQELGRTWPLAEPSEES